MGKVMNPKTRKMIDHVDLRDVERTNMAEIITSYTLMGAEPPRYLPKCAGPPAQYAGLLYLLWGFIIDQAGLGSFSYREFHCLIGDQEAITRVKMSLKFAYTDLFNVSVGRIFVFPRMRWQRWRQKFPAI